MGLFDRIFRRSKQTKSLPSYNDLKKEHGVKEKTISAGFSDYYGGYFSGGDSGGAKSRYGLSADGRSRIIDHYRLRQNARDMYHESMDARGIIGRISDSVVDTGLILESTPMHEILGITPEAAEEWAAKVERSFHLWAMDKKQHRSGILNFYQAQRFYQEHQQLDNEMFTRLFYSSRKTLQNPLQYEFQEPNQIRGNSYTSTYAQFYNDDGIERNSDGTEKAYKVWTINPNTGEYQYQTIPRIGSKSGKLMMIHGFKPEYAGQGRGYARLGFAIQELENLTDFTTAAIKKAINQSNMIMSVENQQKDPGNPLEGMIVPNMSATGATRGTYTEEAEQTINKLSIPQVCPIPEASTDSPGGLSFVGNEQGDHISLLETKAPADNFKDFIMVFTERLASAMSIPVEVVLMKFSANYSASRATLLLFWRVVQIWRQEMNIDFNNPIYESWLSEEIAAGRISAPGWSDPRLRAAWLNCQWIGAPLPSIDPGKEAKARKDNLEMNLTTLEREARNLNGSDALVNIEKNKRTFPGIASPPWSKNNSSAGQKLDNELSELRESGEETEDEDNHAQR